MARARMKPDAFEPFELAEKLNVEPGQVVDFGTFDVTTGKRIETSPAQAGPTDVPITGRIVDLEGRPVAGVSVTSGSFQTPENGRPDPLDRRSQEGEPPWIVGQHVDRNREAPRDGHARSDDRCATAVSGLPASAPSVSST